MKQTKNFKTHIIAGKYKGKPIEIPAIDTTRSSKSILKESLFNTLQFNLIDKNFFEVFAGSGSIGLEALSRGAKHAYFIEKNKIALDTLEQNVKTISQSDSTILFGNSFEKFKIIYSMMKNDNTKTYFYFDPPFAIRENMDDIYEKTIDLISSIDKDICEMVIVEHMSNIELPNIIGNVSLSKAKKFGKSTLSYYAPRE
ncbi:MAG: 16S rRNA (guanine(966)-N(2))-methyltransferase RsmD [Sulfurovaceae bacterium]|nr:16S rRNA (guanine(966)-N(2))-methyltransferase RsmD [Sulfurovaceae bacterium]MDD5548946.1 16S rRNA (guanine(966)-N(2))-methyltransferase RsmD [Sulfurovaceae bacterium]